MAADARPRFAITGVAGYVAPRHLQAISAVNGDIIAALDPHDNVGILDRYSPDCHFFTQFERFDRHLSRLRRSGDGPDWLAVCSPNYLHDSHCLYGLRLGMNVICEKPLVLTPGNLDELQEMEKASGKSVFVMHQLRYHDALMPWRKLEVGHRYLVNVKYVSPRGRWYFYSWKGDPQKSGGLIYNIGVHMFDALLWLFGQCNDFAIHKQQEHRAHGTLRLEHADVVWELSVDDKDLPNGSRVPIRHFSIDGQEVDLSDRFGELHTTAYRSIVLSGNGPGIDDVRPAINLIDQMRRTPGSDEQARTATEPLISIAS